MARVTIRGVENRLQIIRLDGHDYFVLGGSYSRLHHEKIITERYTLSDDIDRQKRNTNRNRWKMTLVVPASSSYVDASLDPGESFHWGDLSSLHTTDDKVYPNDGLQYYDMESLENFGGTYTSYVYMKMDWETPNNNDIGLWQVPIELWGRIV